jgi:hypothetical protein
MTTTHHGSCHCGAVAIDIDGIVDSALSCNCSICARRGSLLWFVPRASLRLTTPEAAAATYTFNRHAIRHRFCPACGIHVFGEGTDPEGNAMAAVNLRCIEGIDLDAIAVQQFDGRAI